MDMSLDAKYIIAPSPEQYYVDKNTGLPLAAGIVRFFSDINRSTPKSVFKLSGSPPNYSYVDIGSEIILSGVGTFQDLSGNNIIPYYYPYDADGNIELYFIQVLSSDLVEQFTREAWPNFIGDSGTDQGLDITNYIPNGQFLLHNNIPANVVTNIPAGQITQAITQIAQGGWTFERPGSSVATDNVSFFRYGSYVNDPSASPRYAVRIACLGPNPSDSFKNLCIKFDDVNKFASTTQEFTFTFSAITDSGADFDVTLYIIKNFGTGGSATTITSVDTFTITNVQQTFSTSFLFGDNSGKIIGSGNDDYVQLALGVPTALSFAGIFTDFSQVIGNINVTEFPNTTNSDFINRSLVPPTPDPNGYDLALPLIMTKNGLIPDQSQVGKIFATVVPTPGFGELNCEATLLRSDGYSADGIPYRRLRNKFVYTNNSNLNIPMWGTGATYVLASQISSTQLFISTNNIGAQTATADGAVTTGFTFTTVITGQPSLSTLGFTAYQYGTGGKVWVFCNSAGYVTSGSNSAAGCPQISMNVDPISSQGEIVGSSVAKQMISFSVNSTPITAGTAIQIANPSTRFEFWFRVNGAGTDPALGGTPVRIDLLSTMGTMDLAYCLSQAISGFQVSTVTVVGGASITANSYFVFYASGQLYYVWYSLNNTGTDPGVASGIGIKVIYSASDSAATVALNTIRAINDLYYALPDLRGWTIKGWANGALTDENSAYRFNFMRSRYQDGQINLPAYIASYQQGVILSHSHRANRYNTAGTDRQLIPIPLGNNTADWATPLSINTTTSDAHFPLEEYGTAENDVKNVYLNYVIKY